MKHTTTAILKTMPKKEKIAYLLDFQGVTEALSPQIFFNLALLRAFFLNRFMAQWIYEERFFRKSYTFCP